MKGATGIRGWGGAVGGPTAAGGGMGGLPCETRDLGTQGGGGSVHGGSVAKGVADRPPGGGHVTLCGSSTGAGGPALPSPPHTPGPTAAGGPGGSGRRGPPGWHRRGEGGSPTTTPRGGGAGGRRLPRPEARPGRRVPPGDSPRRPVTRSGTGGAGSGPAAPEASACGIPPAPGAAPTRRGTGDNVRTGTGVGGVVGVWGQGPPPPHRGGGGGRDGQLPPLPAAGTAGWPGRSGVTLVTAVPSPPRGRAAGSPGWTEKATLIQAGSDVQALHGTGLWGQGRWLRHHPPPKPSSSGAAVPVGNRSVCAW